MKAILPKQLKAGSRIGLVSSSKPYNSENNDKGIDAFIKIMKDKFSIDVVFSKNFKSKDKYGISGGSIKERSDDINIFFDDNSIDLIWCLQGGETSIELLNYLDYENMSKNPKIFTGLSDITVLLNAIYVKSGLVTFHGTDSKAGYKEWHMESDYSISEFKRIFFENEIGKIPQFQQRKIVKKGQAEGVLVGGNMQCLIKLAGTEYFPDLENKILLLEDIGLSASQCASYIVPVRSSLSI